VSEDPKSGGAPKRLRPTVIEVPAHRVKRPSPSPDTPPPTVRKPTAIPGAERRRIAVGSADILRLSPSAEPRTAARAVKLIDGFVVEGARDQHVVQWGQAVQQRAALLSDAPEPPHVDAPDLVRGYVGRIVELLGAIDLVAVRDVERATRDELLHLIHRSRIVLDPLRALLTARDDHARQIDEAGFEIEAAALGATFLAEHLATLRPELSRRFLQREMSLTKTALEIRSGQFERSRQLDEARVLVAVVQDVVLTPLPDWLDGVAALARTRRRANPTQVGDLQHRLGALIRNLEP
jgi:hypothetical protein